MLQNHEICALLEEKLTETLLYGEYTYLSDICVFIPLDGPTRSGYQLCVWGEENDENDKFYSVAVYRTDEQGTSREELLHLFSESDEFPDLRTAVNNVLNEFDSMRLKSNLDLQINAAASRQVDCQSNEKIKQIEPSR